MNDDERKKLLEEIEELRRRIKELEDTIRMLKDEGQYPEDIPWR